MCKILHKYKNSSCEILSGNSFSLTGTNRNAIVSVGSNYADCIIASSYLPLPVFKAFSCIPITPNRDKAFALLHGGIGQVVVK